MQKNLVSYWLLVVFGLSLPVYATSLNSQAEQLKTAYQQLQVSRANPHYQKQFLAAFPSVKKDFNQLFDSPKKDQLYDGNDYIFQLERLANRHPRQTFQLVLKLASQLQWKVGAANYLQFVVMKISLNDPLTFSRQMQSLASSKRRQVIRFMAQGQSGPGIGYSQLVSMLRRLDKNLLANELEKQISY